MHVPILALKTIPITWPFVVLGLDLVGQFRAPGQSSAGRGRQIHQVD
jgi:hypothetical protein